MDEVAWHREPPSNRSTLVTALSGWIDAGEAAADAMRFLVRHLAAVPLAAIDPEDCCDWSQLRPVVRLSAAGERTIRSPRSAFWTWPPPEGGGSYRRRRACKVVHAGPPWISGTRWISKGVTPSQCMA